MTHDEAKVQAILEAIGREEASLARHYKGLQRILADVLARGTTTLKLTHDTYSLVTEADKVLLKKVEP